MRAIARIATKNGVLHRSKGCRPAVGDTAGYVSGVGGSSSPPARVSEKEEPGINPKQ